MGNNKSVRSEIDKSTIQPASGSISMQSSCCKAKDGGKERYDKSPLYSIKDSISRPCEKISLSNMAAIDHSANVQLSMAYNNEERIFLVKVTRCRNLRLRGHAAASPSSYMRLFLFPTYRPNDVRKTRVIDKCRDPVFKEVFVFPLDESQVPYFCLNIQLWYAATPTKKREHLESEINITEYDFDNCSISTALYPLHSRSRATKSPIIDERPAKKPNKLKKCGSPSSASSADNDDTLIDAKQDRLTHPLAQRHISKSTRISRQLSPKSSERCPME